MNSCWILLIFVPLNASYDTRSICITQLTDSDPDVESVYEWVKSDPFIANADIYLSRSGAHLYLDWHTSSYRWEIIFILSQTEFHQCSCFEDVQSVAIGYKHDATNCSIWHCVNRASDDYVLQPNMSVVHCGSGAPTLQTPSPITANEATPSPTSRMPTATAAPLSSFGEVSSSPTTDAIELTTTDLVTTSVNTEQEDDAGPRVVIVKSDTSSAGLITLSVVGVLIVIVVIVIFVYKSRVQKENRNEEDEANMDSDEKSEDRTYSKHGFATYASKLPAEIRHAELGEIGEYGDEAGDRQKNGTAKTNNTATAVETADWGTPETTTGGVHVTLETGGAHI